MTDYSQATNFTAKDALSSGNLAKRVLGSEVDAEFALISTAIGTKANKAVPGTTGDFATLSASGDLQDSGKTPPSGEIVGTSDAQTVSNKALTLVTSLTASANLDIGAYTFTASRLISDIATGTAPLAVSSTTRVANLNVSQLYGIEGNTINWMEFESTPVSIVSAGASVSATTIDIGASYGGSNTLVAVILQLYNTTVVNTSTAGSEIASSQTWVRKNGTAGTLATNPFLKCYASTRSSDAASEYNLDFDTSMAIVEVDASDLIEYQVGISETGSNSTATANIHIVGYIVKSPN